MKSRQTDVHYRQVPKELEVPVKNDPPRRAYMKTGNSYTYHVEDDIYMVILDVYDKIKFLIGLNVLLFILIAILVMFVSNVV